MDGLSLAFVYFLGFICTEGVVEYVLGTLFDKVPALQPHKWTLMYVSMALGIALAFAYSLDLLALVGGVTSSIPYLGVVLTGVLIGRGANFINDLWDKFILGK